MRIVPLELNTVGFMHNMQQDMIRKIWQRGIIVLFCLILTACADPDPSTIIIDDYGNEHYTLYYLKDKRGQRYFPLNTRPTGHNVFVFDPKVFAWAAYDEEGDRVMTGRASGGADYCEDIDAPCRTVTGSFKVYKKRGERCYSSEFPVETKGGAQMPYCMYFFRGYTIHAGYDFSGGNTSHGCIRVLPSAAKWLNESFIKIGTQVVVLSYKDEDGDGDWLRDVMT
jgi:hypothetical protein